MDDDFTFGASVWGAPEPIAAPLPILKPPSPAFGTANDDDFDDFGSPPQTAATAAADAAPPAEHLARFAPAYGRRLFYTEVFAFAGELHGPHIDALLRFLKAVSSRPPQDGTAQPPP